MPEIKTYRSPLACWIGGKFYLSKKIIQLIPSHGCYCEPFLGAGWVLIRKPISKIEVANDINRDLINLWRVLRDKPEELLALWDTSLQSRSWFEDLRDMSCEEIEALSDVEQAWRLFYIIKFAFGGRNIVEATYDIIQSGVKHTRATYGYKVGYTDKFPRNMLLYARWLLAQNHDRLKHVNFECLPWQDILKRYDRKTTFFYLDPPYYGKEKYYGTGFTRDQFGELASVLSSIKGKFILSLNDLPQTRELFKPYLLHTVATTYSTGLQNGKRVTELLISNYEFEPAIMQKTGVSRI